MRKITTPAFLALLLLVAWGCHAPADPEGREYLQALAAMIERSDTIVVTEHSYQYDAFDKSANRSLLQEQVEYGVRELDDAQKRLFLSTVNELDPETQDAFPGCVFEPHHTIRFYASGELISTMEICFKCDSIRWDGTEATRPWSLADGLTTFITTIGLSPERDWAALARQQIE